MFDLILLTTDPRRLTQTFCSADLAEQKNVIRLYGGIIFLIIDFDDISTACFWICPEGIDI